MFTDTSALLCITACWHCRASTSASCWGRGCGLCPLLHNPPDVLGWKPSLCWGAGVRKTLLRLWNGVKPGLFNSIRPRRAGRRLAEPRAGAPRAQAVRREARYSDLPAAGGEILHQQQYL